MLWQHRYLTITVGLGFALALPAFAFDEKAPPNTKPAGVANPPGVAGVVLGLDMLQAASNKFQKANGLRLVKLMADESARAKERATKLADVKPQLLSLFYVELLDTSDSDLLYFRSHGLRVIAKLLNISNPAEATVFINSLEADEKHGVHEILLKDEMPSDPYGGERYRLRIRRGSHPLSAHLAVALGYLPASLFED